MTKKSWFTDGAVVSLSSFEAAYLAETSPSEPLTGFPARLWPSGARTAIKIFSPPEYPCSYAYLAYVKSANPGEKSGSGSAAVRRIAELADDHGVRLELLVSSPGRGKPGLRSKDLKAWYGRLGFRQTETGSLPRMVRPVGGAKKRSRRF